jgi:carbon-monoxide dehydrogenase small subunit
LREEVGFLKRLIELKVNGELHDVVVEPRRTLLEVLREQLGLTGTKEGCDAGDCGACTVLLDGKPVPSCLVLAIDAQGKDILTIEGVANGPELHPIQKAFVDYGAMQCGFCSPGMIITAKALLERNPNPSESEVREAISGNLCRCTGYVKIIEAIMAVAAQGR